MTHIWLTPRVCLVLRKALLKQEKYLVICSQSGRHCPELGIQINLKINVEPQLVKHWAPPKHDSRVESFVVRRLKARLVQFHTSIHLTRHASYRPDQSATIAPIVGAFLLSTYDLHSFIVKIFLSNLSHVQITKGYFRQPYHSPFSLHLDSSNIFICHIVNYNQSMYSL